MRGIDLYSEGAVRQFDWSDRYGASFRVFQHEDELGLVEWFCRPVSVTGGLSEASVLTHDRQGRLLEMAKLLDVRVNPFVESRGIGTMLVQEIIRECRKRGNHVLWGELARIDRDHFPKLETFYRKLGFCVTLYKSDSQSIGAIIGKVEFSL